MFTTSQRLLTRWALLCTLVLTSCTQTGGTPDKPTGELIKALVHGPIESAFLEPLAETLHMTTYDGSQTLGDYDLIMLDGDYHSPAALRDNTLVQEAFDTHKWILVLDATAEHKREGLGQALFAASDGTSPAYAAQLRQDVRGRLEVRIVEYPGASEVTYRQGGGPTGGVPGPAQPAPPPSPPLRPLTTASRADPASASAFVSALLEHLSAPAQVQALPPDIPADLIYATFYFSQVQSWQVGNGGRHPGAQHPNFTANYTFTVFLNNRDNPQGDFQFVLLDADVSASPKTSTEGFVAGGTRDSTAWCAHCFDEWGWFQDRMVVHVQPYPLADPGNPWITVDTSPATANGATNITTSIGFSIGYNQAQGGNASFSFSESTTRTITDWKVTNQSTATGNVASWYYRTQYPLDADYDEGCNGAQYIWHDGCYIYPAPNDLSISNLSLHTQAVWRTEATADDWASFWVWNEHGMVDLYCNNNFGVGCSDPRYQSARVDPTWIYKINLGAVIPIPIQSLTFSPNPAKGGTAVTGTVTLTGPAQVDTDVKLTSNSQNATVLPKVTIKKGETSATFQVLTNTNGIEAGGSTVATIAAFYAQDVQAQLTIGN